MLKCQNHFSQFETTSPQIDWILETETVETLLRTLQIRSEVIDYVTEASREVAQSDELPEFLVFCQSWPEHVTRHLPAKYPPAWQALAAISTFPEAIKKHRARGVPWEITRATLADFQRDALGDHATARPWEFTRLSWMRNHASGNFFEIGRLQFITAKFSYRFRVYQEIESKKITALALPGVKCTSQGWPHDSFTAFETVLQETDEGILGYPALANGSISSNIQVLPPLSKVLLDADSTVSMIHIPAAGKLDATECRQSLREAKEFYEKYFPEISVRAFCTATWILDPEMRKALSPESNVISFGHLFHLLAVTNASDRQLRERVFANACWEHCEAKNSLQKALLQHHNNDGEFRNTAGFILPEEINALVG